MQSQLACVSHLLILAVLAGSSLAVFYTKGKDTDYPRIGRRSFYTSGPGNHYPRIGRRSGAGSIDAADVNPRLLLLGGSPKGASAAVTSSSSSGSGSSAAYSELPKRGVFTQSRHGYPRVGRRSGDGSADVAAASIDLLTSRRHQILERLAELKDGAGSLGWRSWVGWRGGGHRAGGRWG